MLKILMLVNWKVRYTDQEPADLQPPDYVIPGEPYWFFRYFREEVQVDVVDIRSFPALEKLEREKLRFYVWQTLRALPRLHRYDVVLSHGMQSGVVLCLWRRLFGKGRCKHIVFDIGAFNSAREEGGSLRLMQFAGKSLDGVIYHTSGQKTYYEHCHPWLAESARFIPYGADTQFFDADHLTKGEKAPESAPEKPSPEPGTEVEEEVSPEPEIMADLRCGDGSDAAKGEEKAVWAPEEGPHSYILCIGYNKRDWDTLLAAFSQVDTQVHLRLIGNASLTSGDPRVEVLPGVPVRELCRQISGSLFGVLPLESFNYSFGQMTLLQQMLLGKAVIAADVPSLRDYVSDGVTALTYPPKDAAALAGRIRYLLAHPEERERIASAGRESVRTEYSEQIMAERIEEYIHEVMGDNSC